MHSSSVFYQIGQLDFMYMYSDRISTPNKVDWQVKNHPLNKAEMTCTRWKSRCYTNAIYMYILNVFLISKPSMLSVEADMYNVLAGLYVVVYLLVQIVL